MLLAQTLLLLQCFLHAAWADVFRIIDNGQEAAQIRVDLIQQAQAEIAIELYRASEDQMVLAYLALLRDATRRGVKVRFLIDGAFNVISQPLQAHLIEEGMEIREYHPLLLTKLRWATRRLHDKVLLVDRKHMLIGGRNLENPWFDVPGKSYVKRAYVDRDAYVQGKVVEEAQQYFLRLWNSDEVRATALGPYDPTFVSEPCDPSWSEHLYEGCEESQRHAIAGIQRAAINLDRERRTLERNTFVHLNPGKDWAAGQRPVAAVRFWHDPVGQKGKAPGTFEAFLQYVASASESIQIETPYLILSANSLKALENALQRGVKVRILSNSLAATQNFYAQAGYERKKDQWVQMGLELWEYKGPKMLHSKSVVIDDKIAIVGNFNIDPRSEFLNTELAVVAHDRRAAKQLRTSMDKHLTNAWRIGPDGYPIGADERFPGVSAGRVGKLRLYQLFAPLIEKQL
ncbi:MAG: phosphatidylserine/phosphatidylglycerophosphate/cardiolipin synthase family protein [Acidiferrobacterales bacterium]